MTRDTHCRTTALQNVTLSVPVDGAVTDMVSEPKGVWLEETGRALWKFSDVSSIGSIRSDLRHPLNCQDVMNTAASDPSVFTITEEAPTRA